MVRLGSDSDVMILSPVFRSYEKKAPPVSMSKLLSHSYVEGKKKSPNDDDASSMISVLFRFTEGNVVE